MLGSQLLYRLFSSYGEWELLSRCGEWVSHCSDFSCHRARAQELWFQAPERSSCGSRPYLPCSTWDLPGSGIEPMASALAGRFFTTEPPVGVFMMLAL